MDAYLQQIRWRKQINHSQEWVWGRRRVGDTLGQNFGTEWGPEVWEQVRGKVANAILKDTSKTK